MKQIIPENVLRNILGKEPTEDEIFDGDITWSEEDPELLH